MPRKLPLLSPDTAAFWQGGREGRLLIAHCNACERFFHPPAPICPRCASFDVAPRAVSGRATVTTFTVNHQAWTPELQSPYVIAMVTIDEQSDLRFVTNIIGCPPDEVLIDMPVQVRFEQIEDVWLPLFERAPSTSLSRAERAAAIDQRPMAFGRHGQSAGTVRVRPQLTEPARIPSGDRSTYSSSEGLS